ncbi:MAG: hypothetical protein PVJ51_00915 [Acidobacteriota bacterium]
MPQVSFAPRAHDFGQLAPRATVDNRAAHFVLDATEIGNSTEFELTVTIRDESGEIVQYRTDVLRRVNGRLVRTAGSVK